MRHRDTRLVKLMVGLGFFLAPATAQGPATDDDVAQWFTAAQRAKAAGNFALAESEYRKVIDARPDLAEARSNLGLVYYAQGRCADALPHFQRAAAIRPDLDIPVLFTGICLHTMNRYEQAIPFLKRSLSARPPRAEVYMYLGLCYSGLGKQRVAADWFEKFARGAPNEPEAFYQLGGVYLRLSSEHLERARLDSFFSARSRAELGEMQNRTPAFLRTRFEQAIKTRSLYPNLHWRLALVLLRADDLAGARAALTSELQVQREHVPAITVLRSICRRMADKECEAAAARTLRDAGAHFPRDDAGFARLFAAGDKRAFTLLNAIVEMEAIPKDIEREGFVLARTGELTQTLALIARIIRTGAMADWELEVYTRARAARGELSRLRGELEALPASPMADYLLANIYHRLSLGAYAHMLEIDPQGYRTRLLQAETLDVTERDDDAEQAYREVLRKQPQAIGVHYRLGLLLLKRRHVAEAIPELQREIDIDPYNTRARVALGESFTEQHDLEQAVRVLSAVIESQPSDGPALLALARAYSQQQKPALAARMFERALRVQPDDVNAHYQLAQIYQEISREADAEREFALVRKLRAERRSNPVTRTEASHAGPQH